MMCQRCQSKPATVHMEQVINDVKKTHYLCDECAGAHGHTSLDDMIKNLLGSLINVNLFTHGPGVLSPENISNARCTACGLYFDEFKNTGKFGCGECYGAFRQEIQNILRNMSGTSAHTGKIPGRAGVKLKYRRELENLREELRLAIVAEEFEAAAQIRDEIRKIESGGGGTNEQ